MGCGKGDEADVGVVGVSFEWGFIVGRKLGGNWDMRYNAFVQVGQQTDHE